MYHYQKIIVKKITLYAAFLALVFSIVAIYFAKSNSQMVYVDVNKFIEGYSRTKVVKAEFDKKANVDSLVANWQKELKNYKKERATLTPKEMKLKQQL